MLSFRRVRRMLFVATLWWGGAPHGYGQDDNTDDEPDQPSVQATQRPRSPKTPAAGRGAAVAPSSHVRRFHAVLDELLAEFGYDVKMGQIKGLSNIAVRKVTVSQAIPKTYEAYVETLVNERIRDNSQVRVIDCLPCKTRTSSLEGGRMTITSPTTNVARLDAAATALGIENFMDVTLVYHTTHMVLAFDVFNAQTKELLWARTYNSETIKSRYQKLAVDYQQVETAHAGEDYVPQYRFMIGVGGASLPNTSGKSADAAMVAAELRATEKFSNRHNEFGLLVDFLATTSSLVGTSGSASSGDAAAGANSTPDSDPTTKQPPAHKQAFAIHALYARLFVGALESYDEVRTGLHVGLGGVLASGYLAPSLRLGLDLYMGRRFSFTFAGTYVGQTNVVVNGVSTSVKGGPGGLLILSLNF